MKYAIAFFLLLFIAACHRPYALYQPTPPARFAHTPPPAPTPENRERPLAAEPASDWPAPVRPQADNALASADARPVERPAQRTERQLNRVSGWLSSENTEKKAQPQPKPKPKPKTTSDREMRLGNRIRQSLNMPLRKELTWWQRIRWQLKVAVPVILLAVVFAIYNISVLAIIFGLIGAFLLITGLRKSFKVRRPWF
jgi:hypothetical protein